MDGEKRFYQQPWFPAVAQSVFWAIVYVWQIYRLQKSLGGIQNALIYLIIDALLFGAGMVIWLAFFAQFVLPVNKFRERQKIFDRLITYWSGGHGPAIFVQDGVVIAHKGERKKKGPGVMWLDSASALQLRTGVKFTRAIGPGVHFTEGSEYIAGVVDLHTQVQGLGPIASDASLIFSPEPEDPAKKDEYKAAQRRRNETSALTRDGIEVVANINVVFKIDADPVEGEGPGSRFGYKETDKVEDNPVFKAIAGEGINPNAPATPRERQVVAWNRLPASIAADLWREYLSKFTLRELFTESQDIPADKPVQAQPALHETTALYEPVQASAPSSAWQDAIADMLHEINRFVRTRVENLETSISGKPEPPKVAPVPHPSLQTPKPRKGTALEVINAMIKARMTQAMVDELDVSGKRTGKEVESLEFKWLKNRGLRVANGSAGNLRFNPTVEDQLVRQWNATWLSNAKAERDAIERRRKLVELQGQEQALRDFARGISKNLLHNRPPQGSETLRTLLLRTRSELVRSDRLHRRLGTEIEELDEIIRWLEQ